MESDIREQCYQCPCFKSYKECKTFKKLMLVEDLGIVIYQHSDIKDNNKEAELSNYSQHFTHDPYILHNIKDVKITSADIVPELVKRNMSCQRCLRIVEHTKKLVQQLPTVKKNAVIGVCKHCLNKGKCQSSCTDCEEIVKKFGTEYRQRDKYRKTNLWVSKIQNLLQDARNTDKSFTMLESGIHSYTYLSKSERMSKASQKTLPETLKLEQKASLQHFTKENTFDSSKLVKSKINCQVEQAAFNAEDVSRSDRNHLNSFDKELLSNIQQIDDTMMFIDHLPKEIMKEPRKYFKSKSLYDLSKKKSEFSIPGYYYSARKENQNYLDIPSISSTSFSKIEKHTIEPNKTVEGPESKQLKTKTAYGEKMFFKTDSQKFERLGSRDTINNISELYNDEQYFQPMAVTNNGNKLVSVGVNSKSVTKKKSRSLVHDRPYYSLGAVTTSTTDLHKEARYKNFSYSFPTEIALNTERTVTKTSEELILDTRNMLFARAKEQKLKNEENYLRRLQEKELRRLARKKIKTIFEDKKRLKKDRLEVQNKQEAEQMNEDEAKKKLYVNPRKSKEYLSSERQEKNKAKPKLKQAVVKESKSKVSANKSQFKDSGRNMYKSKVTSEQINNIDTIKTNKEQKRTKEDIEKKERAEILRLQKEKNNKQKTGQVKQKRDKKTERQMEKEEDQNKNVILEKDNKEKQGRDIELKRKSKEEKHKKLEPIEQQNNYDSNRTQNKPPELEKKDVDNKDNNINVQNKNTSDAAVEQIKKALLEHAKEKQEAFKIKKQQENEERKAIEAAGKKETNDINLSSKIPVKPIMKSEPMVEEPVRQKTTEKPNANELNVNQIKVRRQSADDLILDLVKLKQSTDKSKRHQTRRLSQLNISPLCIKEHQQHKTAKMSTCLMCIDSDLELDLESIVLKKHHSKEQADIVIGPKIFKYKPVNNEKQQSRLAVPILFQTAFDEGIDKIREAKILNFSEGKFDKQHLSVHSPKYANFSEQERPQGVIRYALSDRTFIDKGWTVLPTEKVVRKINVYRMRPAHPEFDWFAHNKNKRLMLYNTGEKLAEFDDNGLGQWFYKNGRIALDYYNAEEINAKQRIVIYSSGEPDERGRTHPITILATFDYLGNGIVFDHSGKIRLKYNQTEGVLLDRSIGPVSHWKWHTLNDPPVLQKVMIDTELAHKDPEIVKMGNQADDNIRPENEEMLTIEFDNFIKEKSKKLSQTFKPFQIKMKALKINDQFSLKILDQATVYLIFRDGTINLKLNIGMILDHKEIVDTDTAELGEVSNNLERLPARTCSLEGLQRSVSYAQRYERLRTDRERRLYPKEPSASTDRLNAPASRPLRPPFRPESFDSISNRCNCSRKLSSTHLYYNTRLV